MNTPVILVGTSEDGFADVFGLYESIEAAQAAAMSGELPRKYYSVITPALNTVMVPIRESEVEHNAVA